MPGAAGDPGAELADDELPGRVTSLRSARREAFCQQYLVYLDATKSAIAAGYSPNGAKQIAHKLAQDPEVQARLRTLMAARAARLETTADRILDEVDALATSDIGDILEFSEQGIRIRPGTEISERTRRAISSVKVKRFHEREGGEAYELVEFRLWDKASALRLAMQHRGMLIEQHNVNGRLIHEHTLSDEDLVKEIARAMGIPLA